MDKIKDFEINSPRWLSLEDFDGEEWKTIAGYETIYEISNYGRIKYFRKNGRIVYIKKPFMAKHRCNYWMAELYKDHKKKRFFLHRLVAIAFLPNPNNFPFLKLPSYFSPCCVYNTPNPTGFWLSSSSPIYKYFFP